ncbi:MAG: phenazine biosynthesis protein PhzF family [Spirochaetes bacterium GWD1_27_9]|nr:MAG: phenazine biosynthesis protein PhzF family [Spirochaetes bacterium GWB1_27_13]OHD27309.1 MAG: phenazine biosynthesis protein PhzF family [Spirochaetes bacterium GWC1_27_15]OHD34171.1 MAG: phenazine biosynthesis protein PhzF family [Spirochaetes bacterium GWD1_27_9]
MKYYHVDVFSSKPLSGNGLTVVFPDKEIDDLTLGYITKEFKQFETVFIYTKDNEAYPIRIFTIEEELEFAGHPVLGTGAIIHKVFYPNDIRKKIIIKIKERNIIVESEKKENVFSVTMNQGIPSYINTIPINHYIEIAESLNLTLNDIDNRFPLEVVSTGLPYLLIPLNNNIEKCKIIHSNFEQLLNKFNAKFAYVFDTNSLECRTWDNFGLVEDVATGSAAGPLCAYLIKHKIKKENEKIYISQGKYVNRPSKIECWMQSQEVYIKGFVSFFSQGEIYL